MKENLLGREETPGSFSDVMAGKCVRVFVREPYGTAAAGEKQNLFFCMHAVDNLQELFIPTDFCV
ncbi:MAG: hypothetical protein IKF59_02145 [Lachnospiraceae bacterium]|nr:hypothetical protein [Lachnospiraceae bacterium]